jgi:hypothetical protein
MCVFFSVFVNMWLCGRIRRCASGISCVKLLLIGLCGVGRMILMNGAVVVSMCIRAIGCIVARHKTYAGNKYNYAYENFHLL